MILIKKEGYSKQAFCGRKAGIAFILVLAMLIQLLVMNVWAAGEAGPLRMSLRGDKEKLQIGDIIALDIYLDFMNNEFPMGGIAVMKIGIEYDPLSFEPIRDGESYFIKGEILGRNAKIESAIPENTPGRINLIYGDSSLTEIKDKGVLGTLKFKVLDSAKLGKAQFKLDRENVPRANREVSSGNYAQFDVGWFDWNMDIQAPFSYQADAIAEIGKELKITGTAVLAPVHVTLKDETGKDVYSDEITTTEDGGFDLAIPVNSSWQEGKYKIALTYNNMTDERTVIMKNPGTTVQPETPIVVEPAEPPAPTAAAPAGGTSGIGGGTGSGLPGGSAASTPSDPAQPVEITEPAAYPGDMQGHWAEEYVKYVYDHKLMNGYQDGTFQPEVSISRAEFATVMARYLGFNDGGGKVFDDTAEHWARDSVSALAARGIVGGVSDTLFEPDANITREQIAAILDRAFELGGKLAGSVFADDGEISDWAYESVYDVLAAGYMQGDQNNCFAPLASATRAEVATIIYRLHSSK